MCPIHFELNGSKWNSLQRSCSAYFSKACPFANKSVMACSNGCLLRPLPLSKRLAMMPVFSNPSGRRFIATRDVTRLVLGRGREHSKHKHKIPLAIPTLKWGGRAPKSWQFYAHQNCSKMVYHIRLLNHVLHLEWWPLKKKTCTRATLEFDSREVPGYPKFTLCSLK